MTKNLLVVLESGRDNIWTTPALEIAEAAIVRISDAHGRTIKGVLENDGVHISTSVSAPLFAEISLPQHLVPASRLEDAKFALEASKLKIEEKAGRRTVWFSLATAVLSAVVTITVAAITASPPKSTTTAAPPSFRELSECKESLDRLEVLSALNGQTLPDLRAAIRRHSDSCQERLRAALATAS